MIHLDERLVVVHKPAGLLVHRSKQSRDQQFLLQMLRDQIGARVYPVHRLDRATSGVLVMALDSIAARALAEQFEQRSVEKHYLGVVRGWMHGEGEIDYALGEFDGDPRQPALSRWQACAHAELPYPVRPYASARYSLLRLQPTTGRRQQLRRHLHHICHPLVGDTTHGDGHHNRLFRERLGVHRLLLHASLLRLKHPQDGRPLEFQAALDDPFASVFKVLGWDAQALV